MGTWLRKTPTSCEPRGEALEFAWLNHADIPSVPGLDEHLATSSRR
jgi:hypothetical protein